MKRGPTIGVLTAWLGDRYATAIVSGVAHAVAERGGRTVCFPGGRLGSSRLAGGFEAQGNFLYELVGPANVDAVVVLSGALVNAVGASEVAALCARWKPLPVVSVALQLDGIPSVVVDTDEGMRRCLSHLIDTHARKRIAFVRGPENNDEAQRRYRVYREVIGGHGLELDPRIVAPGGFTAASGEAALDLLLDRRKTAPFDAIVAANDAMALAILDGLKRRGPEVSKDLSVVGFDDIEEAQFADPPLTTVRQPLRVQGWLAAETALAMLDGRPTPSRRVLTTELVVRSSCGCVPRGSSVPPPERAKNTLEQARGRLAAERRARMLGSIARALIQTVDEDGLRQAIERDLPQLPLSRCLVSRIDPQSQEAIFLAGYDEGGPISGSRRGERFPASALAPKGMLAGAEESTLLVEPLYFRERRYGLAVLQVNAEDGPLCEEVREHLGCALARIEREQEVARLHVVDTERAGALERAREIERHRRGLRCVLDATSAMLRVQPLDELLRGVIPHFQALMTELSGARVEGLIALTGEHGEPVVRGGTGPFESASLDDRTSVHASAIAACLESGAVEQRPLGTAFPLRASELTMGVVFLGCEVAPRDMELLQVLTNQVAVALRNTHLHELATIDRLTGACVRAYFEPWMLHELRAAYRSAQPIALLMVDVDGLKRINDTQGHLEGDRILATVGRALREAIRGSDCVGRYGGDEFAIVLPQTPRSGAEQVALRIGQRLRELRDQGEKAAEVSIGIAVVEPTSTPEPRPASFFHEMALALIRAADRGLYGAKRGGGARAAEPMDLAWAP